MRALTILMGLIVFFAAPVLAQDNTLDVLVIDETESLTESLAVNIIIGLLRQEQKIFCSVDAVIAKVASPFDLPLHAGFSEASYDMIIVAPKGVISLGEIYLITEPYPQNRDDLSKAIQFLEKLRKDLIDQFKVDIKIQDVNSSFFAGLLSGYFARMGLLRSA